MKFVCYNFRNGQFWDYHSYLALYLQDRGLEKVNQIPDDDFYLIDAPIQAFDIIYRQGISHVDKKILHDIKNKKAGIIFNCENDSHSLNKSYQKKNNPNIVKYFRLFADLLNVQPDSFFYVDSNYRLESVLKNYNLNGAWFSLWEYFLKPLSEVDNITNDILNKKHREKKFLYFGGKAREYRTRFLNSCFKIENFKEESFVSTGEGYYIDTETKEPKWMPTHILDLPNINGGADQHQVDNITEYYHLNSYINIVAMSYFYLANDRIEINEKLFKPIISMQPFVVLGEPRTLKTLRDLGYKTFDKWIDESYDNMLDDNKRYDMVLNEVKKLSKLNNQELSEMLYDMLPVLKHNYDVKNEKTGSLDDDFFTKIQNHFTKHFDNCKF